MFNLKVSGIAAGIAFILSLLIGVITGGSFLAILFRAFLCGFSFFALTAGGYILISRFLPELLHLGQDDEETDEPGSHVDISVEDEEASEEDAVEETFAVAKNAEDDKDKAFKEAVTAALNPHEDPHETPPEETAGLDQHNENGYSKEEETAESPNVGSGTSRETAKPEAPGAASPETGSASPPENQKPPKELDPWEEITPLSAENEGKPKIAVSGKTQNSASQMQGKKNEMDPKKLDPKQMASTIQTMLRQE
ncbi:MAG: hypothetical protein LBG73_09705 [Spirochaetaceae bacterium]|jgi:hypothetical protein|nr:hypothetical protein [Spirochaetaceae bacterium]